MAWQRCGASTFYRDTSYKARSEFDKVFLAPAEMVMVYSNHGRNNDVAVMRRRAQNVLHPSFAELLNDEAKQRLREWALRVIRTYFEDGQPGILSLLDELDQDPIERDRLLYSIQAAMWSGGDPEALELEKVAPVWEDLQDAFADFGVPAC